MEEELRKHINEIIINEDVELSERFNTVADIYCKEYEKTGNLNYLTSAEGMKQAAEMLKQDKFKGLRR